MSPENISYSTSPLLTQWSSTFLGHGFLYYLILFRLSFATASSFLDSLSMSKSFLSSDFKFSLPRWRIESWILRVHSSLSLHCWYTAISAAPQASCCFHPSGLHKVKLLIFSPLIAENQVSTLVLSDSSESALK